MGKPLEEKQLINTFWGVRAYRFEFGSKPSNLDKQKPM